MNTGIPQAPIIIHRITIISESLSGKTNAISRIIKLSSVILAIPIGMLMYADTHNMAVNNAIITSSEVLNVFFIIISIPLPIINANGKIHRQHT